MDPLNHKSKCPKCDQRLQGRREVIGELDHTVWACMPCGLYGVAGDDRMFDRKELGDEELEAKLRKRAAKLIENEKALQRRFTDVPPGKVFG